MKTIYKIDKNKISYPLVVTLVVTALLSSAYYSFYLFNASNREDFLIYILLVFIEFYVLLTSAFTWWTILFYNKGIDDVDKIKHKSAEAYVHSSKIALLMVCYSEDLALIEKAFKASLKVKGNPTLYVGDDSRREEVNLLAQKYNINYLCRQTNVYFKAGNLNSCFTKIDADFIAVFDIDHTPLKNFLFETIPYFYDKEVALVQSPQYYKNTENIISQSSSGAQNIFYELIMPGKNAFNSCICVGTNVVYRKEALDKSLGGGIYLIDHSEDLYTSFKLHVAGWKTIYVPKILAKGLAPTTVKSFFSQQLRWARGGHSLLIKNNPLFIDKLSIDQKLQYFFSSTHYLSGFVILFYLLIPLLYLYLGIKPFSTYTDQVWLYHFLPFFISKFLLGLYLMSSFNVSLLSTSLALFPVYIKAFFLELFNSNYQWVATNDKSNKNEYSIYDDLFWHFTFIVFSVLAIVIGILTSKDSVSAYIFSFWASLNSALLIHFVYNSLKINYQTKNAFN